MEWAEFLVLSANRARIVDVRLHVDPGGAWEVLLLPRRAPVVLLRGDRESSAYDLITEWLALMAPIAEQVTGD